MKIGHVRNQKQRFKHQKMIPLFEAEEENPLEVSFENFSPDRVTRHHIYRALQKIEEVSPSNSRIKLTLNQLSPGTYTGQFELFSYQQDIELARRARSLIELMDNFESEVYFRLIQWKRNRFQASGDVEPQKPAS